MKFKVADKITHRSDARIRGVVLRVSAPQERYYVSWWDTHKRGIHTKDFIEEHYVRAED